MVGIPGLATTQTLSAPFTPILALIRTAIAVEPIPKKKGAGPWARAINHYHIGSTCISENPGSTTWRAGLPKAERDFYCGWRELAHGQAQKKQTTLSSRLLFIKSGYQDSNLGPPAPKAGALTGLRYIPFVPFCGCKDMMKIFILQIFFKKNAIFLRFLSKKCLARYVRH